MGYAVWRVVRWVWVRTPPGERWAYKRELRRLEKNGVRRAEAEGLAREAAAERAV